MWKSVNFVLLILFCIATVGCRSTRIPDDDLRRMELEDHRLCLIDGVTNDPEIVNELYWKCRLRAVDSRITALNPTGGLDLLYQGELEKIRKLMKNRVERAQRATEARIDRNIDEKDDEFCREIGYPYSKHNRDMMDEYYRCRAQLVRERSTAEPFALYSYEAILDELGNTPDIYEYYNYKYGYNTDPKARSNLDADTARALHDAAKIEEKYPVCKPYPINTYDFKQCVLDQNAAQACYDDIPSKVSRRKLNDQIFCDKKAMDEFPDELAVYSNTLEQRREYGRESAEGIENTGPKLSKTQVQKYRTGAIDDCLQERNKKLVEYTKYLPSECAKISNAWLENNK